MSKYRDIVEGGTLLDIVRQLQAQGMRRPTLRSCYYLLVDRGLLDAGPGPYKKLDEFLSDARDDGTFPYGLLAPEGGQSQRGLTSVELDNYLKAVSEQNVEPRLIDGLLNAVWVEKIGLVPYIVDAVRGEVPVGSSGGNIRKEWARQWASELAALCDDLDGEGVRLLYLADHDHHGRLIADRIVEWLRPYGIETTVFAVTAKQAKAVHHRGELHLDGYVALRGPQVFASDLRTELGL